MMINRSKQNGIVKVQLTVLFLIFFFSCSGKLFAQGGKIAGSVFTAKNIPAENATVSLLRIKDSVLVKSALPGKDGFFEFEQIKSGSYLVGISHTGYKKFFSEKITLNEQHTTANLPPVELLPDLQAKQTATVEARKPFIERKADRLIVNVENSIVSTGSNLLSVLERSPGVVVTEESSISLRGKQGVVFMIDGKPTPLSGTDLINYLKSMPAAMADKIEIITNPSAKYDAAGNAGIINIKLKKDQRQGFNGSASVNFGQGVYFKPSANTNLNFRKKKWNLFGSYALSHPRGFTRFYINRRFFSAPGITESVFDQTSFIKQPINSNNIKTGADFSAGKKTVIGVLFNANLVNSSRNGFTQSEITNPDGSIRYTSQTNNLHNGSSNNYFGNINLKHTIDSTGRELTADVDMGRYRSLSLQDFKNQYFDAAGNPDISDRLKTDQSGIITVKSIKADYLHPLKKNGKVEAGLKASLVKTDSDIQFFNVNGGTVVPDAARSNHFIYRENVNAAYVNMAREFKKMEVQAGLRMEHTVTRGKQVTTGQEFSRNYILFFPSFAISRKLTEKHQLGITYSRRIDRPSYRQLNPFKIFVDPYTYVVGDPELRPVLSNSYELNHTFKNKYITTLSYLRSRAVITDIFTQDDVTRISYQSPANLNDFEQYNLAVNIPFGVKKWMNSNLVASVYRNNYRSPLQGGQLQNSFTAWDINLTNAFVLGKKGWTAELSGFYQSKNAWGLFMIKNLAQVSAGIQKVSKNKKSTYKLAASDVFSTNHIAVIVKYQNMDFHTDRTWDSQVLTFSLTHRFGKNTVARARQRNTGIEDEKRRAG